jgi:predicted nucleic acid-binding Zn ribbon protein
MNGQEHVPGVPGPPGAAGASGSRTGHGKQASQGSQEPLGPLGPLGPQGGPGKPREAEGREKRGERPGRPKAPELSGVDLARVALLEAKKQARARGEAAQQKRQAKRGGGLRSGARADGRDPMALGAAINRLMSERGWETPAAVGGVMGRWPQIVGDDVAKHCGPETYDEDERTLVVRCDSTAWATNLRLLAPQLVRRLNEDLGHGAVTAIKVLGPGGPARRYGPLRAPGSRGPRDTYG